MHNGPQSHNNALKMETAIKNIITTAAAPSFAPSLVTPNPKSSNKCFVPAMKWYSSAANIIHKTNENNGLSIIFDMDSNPSSDSSDVWRTKRSKPKPANIAIPDNLWANEAKFVSGKLIVDISRFTGLFDFKFYPFFFALS